MSAVPIPKPRKSFINDIANSGVLESILPKHFISPSRILVQTHQIIFPSDSAIKHESVDLP
jgi:hypothetical protein